MAQRTVNQRQHDVLKWIGDGCPAGRWAEGDTSYKTTAVALKGRRLVTISKRKGVWSAALTDAGRHFVTHGEYPEGHWIPSEPPTTAARRVAARTTKKKITGLRPVDQLMLDLANAGGTLTVEDPEHYYGNLVASATRYGKVPEGKLLRVTNGPKYGWKVVTLVDKPDWMTTVLDPIRVPERLAKPHPAVAAIRANKEQRLLFKARTRHRALLLLDALAKEATRRGYTVEAAPLRRTHSNHYDPPTKWDMRIAVGEHEYDITVTEETDKTPHEATVKELAAAAKPFGMRPPKYDHAPSGRLKFNVSRGWTVRQENFGDTKTLNLNDRLAEVLQEIELRAADAEQRRLAKEREEAERQARWQAIRDQAVIAYNEQYKADILEARTQCWEEHTRMGAYLDALAARLASLPEPERDEATAWLSWAREHHSQNDPFAVKFLHAPDVPEPKAEQLKPFMHGHDPYGARGW